MTEADRAPRACDQFALIVCEEITQHLQCGSQTIFNSPTTINKAITMSLDLPSSSDFADNPEPRCPCVLLVDSSFSMSGEPIRKLNEGLRLFKEDVMTDELARNRVEVAIVTFGGTVSVEQEYCVISDFQPPTIVANGNTPMGDAIAKGAELIETRKAEYKANGIGYFRPWVFLITDGEPTDLGWETKAEAARAGDADNKFIFFGVAVEGANMETLTEICPEHRPPVSLNGLSFGEMFKWLSKSLQQVSKSSTPTAGADGAGGSVELAPISGWGSVGT